MVTPSTLNIVHSNYYQCKSIAADKGNSDTNTDVVWEKKDEIRENRKENIADYFLTLPRIILRIFSRHDGRSYIDTFRKSNDSQEYEHEIVQINPRPDKCSTKFWKVVCFLLGFSILIPLIGYGIKKRLIENDTSGKYSRVECFIRMEKIRDKRKKKTNDSVNAG